MVFIQSGLTVQTEYGKETTFQRHFFPSDLANEIKETNRGIPVNDDNICLLLYAVDIVLLAENENDMQHVLDILWKWCEKWRINVNISKSNVMHFRRGQLPQSTFNFKIGNQPLLIVEQYRYLGVIFHLSLIHI
mgnify:CR=1 FL=1